MIAESIAHYRIIEKLGAGGMGEVYLALDTRLERKVAIKVLKSDSLAEENLKKRLLREARAVAKLDHPNICTVYDVNAAGALTFIVMQYIAGETLAERMRCQSLEVGDVLTLIEQAAEGLAEAHAHGIVHRDLKPQNLMITPRGQLKILDFGLAKQLRPSDSVDPDAPTATLLSTPGTVVGTLPYMSPEQLRDEPLDARSDIFSLGVTFYEMLAGKHSFYDKNTTVTLSRIMLGEPLPTEKFHGRVSPELQALLGKMLRKDKTERYQSVHELLTELRQLPAKSLANVTQAFSAPTKKFPAITTQVTLADGGFGIAWQHKWAALASGLTLILLAFAISRWVLISPPDSLAVLPFSYISGDPRLMANPDREYLNDGLTESIINNLSQLNNLRVIARSSVFRYKGSDLDAQAIGRKLNVHTVLVGEIAQEGDALRIRIELIDVAENRSIWLKTYQRKTADVQTVQTEIAQNVSAELRLKLTGADKTQMAKSYTASGAAYEAYLKGRYYWNKRTDEGFKQASKFFQEAINQDPTYALAYTGLADCYTLRSDYGFLAPQEGYALAKGAAMLALKYDDSLAEAHASLASIKAVADWDWQGAEREYRRAIELNPNYPTAHHWYGAQLFVAGKQTQALQELRQAQQLDPLSLGINKDLAVALLYARDHEKALEQCRKTLEIEPRFGTIFTYIAQIYELQQRYPEAIAELERAHAADPADVEIVYALGQAYALGDRKDAAQKIADELNQAGKQSVFLPKEAAYLADLLGNREQAVVMLQKAAENHYISVAELKTDPRLDELRKDARIGELLRNIGLSP